MTIRQNNRSLNILANARIAAPCSADWTAMQGDDQVRHCAQCDKHVYNLVGMSNEEADAFLTAHAGNACIRAYQRADGTLLTENCPVGLRKLRRRMAVGMGAIAAGFATLFGVLTFGYSSRAGARLTGFQPFKRLARWVNPPGPYIKLGSPANRTPTAPLGGIPALALGKVAPAGVTICGSTTYTIAVRENGELKNENETILGSPGSVPFQLLTTPVTIPYQPGYVPESEDLEIGIPMIGNAWRPPLKLPSNKLEASNDRKSLGENE